jgi:exosortase E/protease (VPEID-CTERM system)
MTTPLAESRVVHLPKLSLGWRLVVIAGVLIIESVLHTLLYQSIVDTGASPFGELVQDIQHLIFRFAAAYVVLSLILISVNRRENLAGIGARHSHAPVRPSWFALHVFLIMLVGALSFALHTNAVDLPYLALVLAWFLCGVSATVALFAALAPIPVWVSAASNHRGLLLYAIAPAVATIIAIHLTQSLWRPAAKVTFVLVEIALRPFVHHLSADIATMTLDTGRFAVMIGDVCSGLEGIGLMLIFCFSWLWFFRREYYFPRALIIVPIALVLTFLLNTVRIAAMVLIGDAGYPKIAIVGFHSQAGWIAFNAVAFAVAILARHSPWLNRIARDRSQSDTGENPTAPYLVPLLAILAGGMIAHALSAGFDVLYPLRLIAGAAALWFYRQHYKQLLWRFSWRAVAVGTAIFALWLLFDRLFAVPRTMPDTLAQMSGPARAFWVVCRSLAAIITVPIAEELAYRGYLMRLFVSRHFDSIALRDVRWPALALAALIFGVTHGVMWLPGIIAGLAYGLLAIRRNNLGEAIAAHATTNGLLAGAVILFDQWQLW